MGGSQSTAPPGDFVGVWKWEENGVRIQYEIEPNGRMSYLYKSKTEETSVSGYGMSGWLESADEESEVKGNVCCCCSLHLKVKKDGENLIITDVGTNQTKTFSKTVTLNFSDMMAVGSAVNAALNK